MLAPLAKQLSFRTVKCGLGAENSYRASAVETDSTGFIRCDVTGPEGTLPVEIRALGSHMIYPTLIAAAVAEHFGMTGEEIARGVLQFAPTRMRMNIVRRGNGITILDDAYNANPQSMRAAVEVLAQTNDGYKIAVLGDMFELGPFAPTLHASVGTCVAKGGINCLIAVGELAHHIYNAALEEGVEKTYWCATKEEAMPVLEEELCPNATVLVKASRGMAFENLVAYLKQITPEP
jgi:UDP-N-acetylmuramoyl-tripeptide--D-alanyl-D-alanine ligase